jgi:hypothetical protein
MNFPSRAFPNLALMIALMLVASLVVAVPNAAAPPAHAPQHAAVADQPAGDQLTGEPPARPSAARPQELSPMMREIVAACDASQIAVDALTQQIAATTDATAALALQRQVEQMRSQLEIELLQIQARYARQEGRLADAAEIEAAIEQMMAPRPRGVTVPRALPDEDGSGSGEDQ